MTSRYVPLGGIGEHTFVVVVLTQLGKVVMESGHCRRRHFRCPAEEQ
jgi:hypothetical protein